MGKTTDLVTVVLAIWRLGAVYVPLFTAFAPQAIALRLEGAGAHVVVVGPDQRHKLDPGPTCRRTLSAASSSPDPPGDSEQTLCVYNVEPGSDTAHALQLLTSWTTPQQEMVARPPDSTPTAH
ncbi:AMP-binding protein [Streptomyces sp. NPDC059875]|uniref:AMP-binding protein n=1 Tax=unclassified Streptomyces TaxID=2593676 RepID=UPI0036488FE3